MASFAAVQGPARCSPPPCAQACWRIGAPVLRQRPGALIGRRAAAAAAGAAPPRHRRVAAPRAAVQEASTASFDKLLAGSSTPVLVDFYTTWCGPCQIVSKAMAALEPAMRDRVQFVKLDTEKNPAIAERFDVHLLPTLILFDGGQPVNRVEGAMTAQDLQLHLLKTLKALEKTAAIKK